MSTAAKRAAQDAFYEALLQKQAIEREEQRIVTAALHKRQKSESLSFRKSSPSFPLLPPEKKEPPFIDFKENTNYAPGTYQDDFNTYIVEDTRGMSYHCTIWAKDRIQNGPSRKPSLIKKGAIISTCIETYCPANSHVKVEEKRVVPLLRMYDQFLPFADYLWERKKKPKKVLQALLKKERTHIEIHQILYYFLYGGLYNFFMVLYIPPFLFYFLMGVLRSVSYFVRPPDYFS